MMWNVCRIDDLGDINRGKSKHRPRNDARLFGGKYPFIQTGDVKKANLYITEFDTTYSEFGLAQSRLWPKDTLCITIAANIAESAILGFDACFPDSVVGFVPKKNKADLKFVKYLLDEFKVYMQQISKGTTQDNLSLDKLRRVKFYAPDYDVQVKIAKVISAYDDLIENNNKRIKILEKMAENLYKEWFVRFRFPGCEKIKMKECSPSGWVVSSRQACVQCPEHWNYGALHHLNSFKRGKNITAAEMVEGVIPVISAGIEPSGYHCSYNVEGKSLTISSSGANAGYLQCHFTSIWAADCSYCQDKNQLWFIFNALKFLQPVISNMQVGSAQPHVYPKHINKLCTILPNEELIAKYCKMVEPIYEQISILQEKNKNLTKQRDMLLPRLMSRKLEV